MGALDVLYLNDNAFSGNMPVGYSALASVLQYLDISNNPAMTGTVPTTFSLLTSLSWFNYCNTSFSYTTAAYGWIAALPFYT